MHLGNNNPLHRYFIRDGYNYSELEITEIEKDLGVYVDNKLNFNDHVQEVIKKSKQIMWTSCLDNYI